MSHRRVVTLSQIGDVSIVCKTKRDMSGETPFDKRDDESLGWGYWDRIWPSSVALSEYLIHQYFPQGLAGLRVLEIGCGTGLPGIVAARLGGFTMFSDLVPVTLEAVKESCQLNSIMHFSTCNLDWSKAIALRDEYDVVIGSEIFYDDAILPHVTRLLDQVLAPEGKGIFCDPNRLGLDSIKLAFQEKFHLSGQPIPLNWPPRKNRRKQKLVYRYELTRNPQKFF